MSRLTASPFHKPSPFSVTRPAVPVPLLSPPDTDREFMQMHQHSSSRTTLSREPVSQNPQEYDFPEVETRSRKGSSLSYNTSGLRESRQRTVQRGLKTFVIVIPPPSFLEGHGQLGTTLSSGPIHRLSQGILMPLFPSMHAQLTAIAREFNFPSTTGLCLYLHYTESGITLSPRISDDSWAFLWSHAFEPRSVQPGLPISGRIEFDIDHQQARWYSSWLSSSHREYYDIQRSASPSLALQRGQQFSHIRGESRTTFPDGSVAEESNEREYAGSQPQPQPRKHVPKKLSLVDRYDSLSVRSGSRTIPAASAPSPPEAQSRNASLSPIVQEDEPQTARQNLQTRVNSWRASATLQPTPLAAVGQISLEPANLPNNMDLDDEQLNLEDFAWSISSLGPGDSPLESIASWDRVQSVHLDGRLQGSVCLTPTTCTSFGPPDYDMDYVDYADDIAYTFSPDIARRQFSDCPLTPSTVTSWGAPLSYPSTPGYVSETESLDIAHRGTFSRSVTPLTATSWGVSSYAGSPVAQFAFYERTASVHLGDRGDFSRPVTPSTATSWGAPSEPIFSPTTSSHVQTPHPWERTFDAQDAIAPPSQNWGMTWPRYQVAASEPWGMTWPHYQATASEPWPLVWPGYNVEHSAPWERVWPYTAQAGLDAPSGVFGVSSPGHHASELTTGYPHFNIYPAVYPWNLDHIYPALGLVSRRDKSALDYPHNLDVIYPAVQSASPISRVDLPPAYPHNLANIYPAVHSQEYPYNLKSIYPNVHSLDYPLNLQSIYPAIRTSRHAIKQRKTAREGVTGYPHNLENIYPVVHSASESRKVPASNAVLARGGYSLGISRFQAHSGFGYPENLRNIYSTVDRASSLQGSLYRVYPYNLLNIYPAPAQRFGYPDNLRRIYPAVERPSSLQAANVNYRDYPYNLLNIYPTQTERHGYPENLLHIYPPLRTSVDSVPTRAMQGEGYPYNLLNIYPAQAQARIQYGYPENLMHIYPSGRNSLPTPALANANQQGYPFNLLNLYPAQASRDESSLFGYPLNLDAIYPPVRPATSSEAPSVSSREILGYPHNLHNIYPLYSPIAHEVNNTGSLEYPFNLQHIYPAISSAPRSPIVRIQVSGKSGRSSTYPWNVYCIYPPLEALTPILYTLGYPHNLSSIYPPLVSSPAPRIHAVARDDPGYPYNLDHIYPVVRDFQPTSSPRKKDGYPWNLLCIYPAREEVELSKAQASTPRSDYPWNLQTIYPPLYPQELTSSRRQPSVEQNSRSYSSLDFHRFRASAEPRCYLGYPHNLDHIYVRVGNTCKRETHSLGYPWNLYCIYPSQSLMASNATLNCANKDECNSNIPAVTVVLEPAYPNLIIYHSVYPWNLSHIYPSISSSLSIRTPGRSVLRQISARLSRPLRRSSLRSSGSNQLLGDGAQAKRRVHFDGLTSPQAKQTAFTKSARKTHKELHDRVFTVGEVSTPSGTAVVRSPTTSPRSSRQLSHRLSLPPPSPSPTHKLPPIPVPAEPVRSGLRASPPTAVPPFPLPRPRMRPIAPRPATVYSERSDSMPAVAETSEAPPRDQRRVGYKPPTRSVSLALPSSPAVHLARSNSSSKSNHIRRDSLVLQRIRALNNSSSPVNEITEEDLAQFPAPPRPSQVRTGKLDRSKFPFV